MLPHITLSFAAHVKSNVVKKEGRYIPRKATFTRNNLRKNPHTYLSDFNTLQVRYDFMYFTTR